MKLNIERLVETCLVQSLLELKYSLTRVTNADRDVEARTLPFLIEPLKVTYLIAAEQDRPPFENCTSLSAVVSRNSWRASGLLATLSSWVNSTASNNLFVRCFEFVSVTAWASL